MKYFSILSLLMLTACAGGLAPSRSIETPTSDVAELELDNIGGLDSSLRPFERPADLVIVAVDPIVVMPANPAPASDATAVPEVVASDFGTTVASLGDATEGGIWIKTPLVSKRQRGKVSTASGQSIEADLIPIDGPDTAGSRISLQAMLALGLPLTALPELVLAPL